MSDEQKKSRSPKGVVYLALSKGFEAKVEGAVASIHRRAPRLAKLVTKADALKALAARAEKSFGQQDLESLLLHDLLGDMADLLKAPPVVRVGQPVILDSVEESKVPEV